MQPAVLAHGEVISPCVVPGMKQGHDKIGPWIYRSDIGTLLQVASDATQTQVIFIICSMVLAGNDVVDLMRQNRGLLGEVAVLACAVGAALDDLPRLFRELHEAARMVQISSA